MAIRELLVGPLLRGIRHVALSDRFLWPAARFALAHHKRRTEEIDVRTADGFRMGLRLSQYPDGAMYFGVFEISTVRLIKSILRAGDCAIDVGANIGFMTMHMARACGPTGRVDSFEPVPSNRHRLEKAISENGFRHVSIHPQALGDKLASTIIYDASSVGAHAESSLRPLHENAMPVPCDIVRLDDVVSAPVRLMKVDVEGSEVGVLRGAQNLIRQHKPHIIIENNSAALKAFGTTFKDVCQAIHSAYDGYQAYLTKPFTPRLRPDALNQNELENGNVWFKPIVKHVHM